MSTTLRYRSERAATGISADTAIHWREVRPRGVRGLRRSRVMVLVACLALVLALWLTGGGGEAFYDALYLRVSQVRQYLGGGSGVSAVATMSNRDRGEKLRLRGIVYSPTRPIAVINDANFAPGDQVEVTVGKRSEVIRCVEIDAGSVRIQTRDGAVSSLRMKDPPEDGVVYLPAE